MTKNVAGEKILEIVKKRVAELYVKLKKARDRSDSEQAKQIVKMLEINLDVIGVQSIKEYIESERIPD